MIRRYVVRASIKRRGFLLLKYAVAAAMLWYVVSRLELEKLYAHATHPHIGWLAVAFLLFNLAQIVGAERMRYYYRQAGKQLPSRFCIALSYVSMIYNILIPGGVGGDGYRIYVLRKTGDFPVKQGIRLQLSNRASGLLALLTLLCALMLGLGLPPAFVLALLGFTVLGYILSARFLLHEAMATAAHAFLYSLAIQLLSLFSAAALVAALGLTEHYASYLALFLAAQVAGMLPLTVGGLGIRELTFLYGAQELGVLTGIPLDAAFGVALSLAFFLLTLAVALLGSLFAWTGKRIVPNGKS